MSQPFDVPVRVLEEPAFMLALTPIPGASIERCFDQALQIALKLGVVVKFKHNGVECGVRPKDGFEPKAKEWFVHNFHKTKGNAVCYGNKPKP